MEITDGEPVYVGRDPSLDYQTISLQDVTVAREHFHLEIRGGKLFLESDNRKSPTYVGRQGIRGMVELEPGNVYYITAGLTRFCVAESQSFAERALLSTEERYYFSTNGITYGPFEPQEKLQVLTNGVLTPNSVVWMEKTPGKRIPASKVSFLKFHRDKKKQRGAFLGYGIALGAIILGIAAACFLETRKSTASKLQQESEEKLAKELSKMQEGVRSLVQTKLQRQIEGLTARQSEIESNRARIEDDERTFSDAVSRIQQEQLIEKKRGKEYVLYYLLEDGLINELAKQYLGADFQKERQEYTAKVQKLKMERNQQEFFNSQQQNATEARMMADSERQRVEEERMEREARNQIQSLQRQINHNLAEQNRLRRLWQSRYTQNRDRGYRSLGELQEESRKLNQQLDRAKETLVKLMQQNSDALAQRKREIAELARQSAEKRILKAAMPDSKLEELVTSCAEATTERLSRVLQEKRNTLCACLLQIEEKGKELKAKLSQLEWMNLEEMKTLME